MLYPSHLWPHILSPLGLWTILILLINGATCIEKTEYSADVCTDNILCSFQHLEIDTKNQKLYLGAVNKLYQLTSDLTVERSVITGPLLNSDECFPHSICEKPMVFSDNYNKLLKIDFDNDRIVVCGTLRQGICDLRQLGNITKLLNDFSHRADDPRANDFVASTLPEQSTVAFIASDGNGQDLSLFVGSSKTPEDSNLIVDDDQFLTFASRRMPRDNMDPHMFSSDWIRHKDASTTLGLLMKEEYYLKPDFRIDFISAFAGKGNGYFVLNYPRMVKGIPDETDKRAYVAQVCVQMDNAKITTNSYMEIPISSLSYSSGVSKNLYRVIATTTAQVGSDLQRSVGITFGKNPHVLFASFATEGSNEGGSTVAMFPLHELDNMYYLMIKSCIQGNQMPHVDWQRETELPCNPIQFQAQESVCANRDILDVVGLLKSRSTKQGYTIFESNDTEITSLAVMNLKEHTVVFMGTSDGRLLKLKIDSKPVGNRLPQPYESLTIDSHSDSRKWKNLGSPKILSDMRFDNELTRLYVMSERRLVSLPLHDCTKYHTCYDCLKPGDPFCGWCTLENRCTAADQCQQDKYKYATSSPDNCPKLRSVDPEAISVKNPPQDKIEVAIQFIPSPSQRDRYFCSFGGGSYKRVDRFSEASLSCRPPSFSEMPTLNGQEVSRPLTLYYKGDNGQYTMIASTEIVFYDCENFKSCLPCVSSDKFKCHWCVHDNQCTEIGDNCQNTPGEVSKKDKCPQLVQVREPHSLHVGQTRKFKVDAKHLPSIGGSTKQGFGCKFEIEGKITKTVNASHTNQFIVCGAIKGFLPEGVSEAKVSVDVLWKGKYVIDNPNHLNVTMYQCSRGNDDNCGKCIQLSKELSCGWCESTNTCTLCNSCNGAVCWDEGELYPGWLDQAQVCKHPKINDFYPKSAAPGGVTKITIEGENLGRNISELQSGITIAGEVCEVEDEGYIQSERVVCTVRDVRGEGDAPVRLCIQNFNPKRCRGHDYTALSTRDFRFVEPVLDSFDPKEGMVAGGTNITFQGQHLNIGNNVSVLINGRQCHVNMDSLTSTSFNCQLACNTVAARSRRHAPGHNHHSQHRGGSTRGHRRSKRATGGKVMVIFDKKEKFSGSTFLLEDNATVTEVSPRESITSGGMKLIIKGNNLHLAQKMVLKVSLGIHTNMSECAPPGTNKKIRECLSPSIEGFTAGNYSASLILDSCLTLDIQKIKYTRDPFLNEFEEDDRVKQHQSGPIIITGRDLCPNPTKCYKDSVRVDIGDSLSCNVTSLDKDKIVCVPPEGATGTHVVVVHIGGYSQSVGDLAYDSQFPTVVVIVLAIIIVVVIVVVVVFFCVYRNRADKNSQTVKQLQMQLDMMEAKVAKECKEAFAELQTDMQSDLDNLSSLGGIPFRLRRDYIMRVLFPDPDMYDKLNQAMHHSSSDSRFNMHNGRGAAHRTGCQAMENFDKLLENRNFLLIFITTLEQQRKFTMKDKGNVAGLLMIVLQDRLQYATDILEKLLEQLIQNSMDSKSHPKLLLRRTESVAEKMLTHWFSILLHGFLLECAGEPLFMLYRAIKAQLDKGPIDAISGEAKYSLSEDKLLRQGISYEQLVLLVTENDAGDSSPSFRKLQVKVLDCDTISQTKEKIIAMKYRNQPQSQHPDPNDFDLELIQETLGPTILSDEDNTSVIEGGWKRINTLLHYKVKDRTVVTMVPKRPHFNQSMNSNHMFGARVGGMRYNGSGQRLINDGSSSLPRHMTSMQGSRSTTPTIIDDGKKLYHLTKQHDTEPKDGGSDVGGNKMASEIYLTRLLATKGTIQKFVDDLFETIFSVVQRGHALPLAIKHMFDFLDDQAGYHGVVDPDVVHTWKSNCLPLRFWVNLIKNPQFLFDIDKSPLVDSCLTVIGQTFMDSCSKSDHVLGKDSPSNKLLYAKDIPNYKEWVERYYNEISVMEPLNPQDMRCFLDDESRTYRANSSSQAALTQLYLYVQKYNSEILGALNNDTAARSQRLAQRLEQVATTMTSTV